MDAFLAAHPLGSEIERERARAILARVDAAEGSPCGGCGAILVGQEIVESVVLGYQDEPRCHRCHAAEHDELPGAFLERMREYVARVPCFDATWQWCASKGGSIEERSG